MRSPVSTVLLLAIVVTLICSPAGAQTKFTPEEKERLAASVRQEFAHAWGSYKKYAWGHDALHPLSKKGIQS